MADEARWAAAADEDDLDDEERAALHAALEAALAEAERGEVYPIEAVLDELAPTGEAGAREAEAAWLAEVRQRAEELEAGLVPGLRWEEVRAEAEGLLVTKG